MAVIQDLPEKYRKDISSDEKVLLAIEGYTRKTWLVCTEKRVWILQHGFLNGHAFGSGVWSAPYSQITGVVLDWHVLGGNTLSVLTPATQNTVRKGQSTWTRDQNNTPNVLDCSGFNKTRSEYQKACDLINKKVSQAHQEPPTAASSNDVAGELAKLAGLHQKGVLTDDEFAAAKRRVLGA